MYGRQGERMSKQHVIHKLEDHEGEMVVLYFGENQELRKLLKQGTCKQVNSHVNFLQRSVLDMEKREGRETSWESGAAILAQHKYSQDKVVATRTEMIRKKNCTIANTQHCNVADTFISPLLYDLFTPCKNFMWYIPL